MKRLLVCSLPQGGICHYTYCLADALQRTGDATTVLTLNKPNYELADIGHAHQVLSELRVSTTKLARAYNPLLNQQTLLRQARQTEVVHFQWPLGPRSDPRMWRALKRQGKRLVYTAHNVVPHEAGNRNEAHTVWLYEMADAIIVHGERLKAEMLAMHPDVAGKLHVIALGNYNFIADHYAHWDRAKARASFGWSEQEQVVLFFGLIRHYKGLDTLIEACGRVLRQTGSSSSQLRLLIAGANLNNHWQEGGYQEQIAKAGLVSHTRCILEHVPMADIARYFLASDIVALPYRSGSQSAVLPLAYAFSKPAIATQVGSIHEALEPNVSALVIPPENPEALAASIHHLLACPPLAEQIGRQGRAYAETNLSWDRIAAQTQAVYASLGA